MLRRKNQARVGQVYYTLFNALARFDALAKRSARFDSGLAVQAQGNPETASNSY